MGKEVKTELPQTLEAAHSLIQEQEAKIISLEDVVTKQAEEIDRLGDKVEDAKAGVIAVKIGKKKYQVNCGVQLEGGKKLTASQLADDADACAKLLKIEGQTFLTELEEE